LACSLSSPRAQVDDGRPGQRRGNKSGGAGSVERIRNDVEPVREQVPVQGRGLRGARDRRLVRDVRSVTLGGRLRASLHDDTIIRTFRFAALFVYCDTDEVAISGGFGIVYRAGGEVVGVSERANHAPCDAGRSVPGGWRIGTSASATRTAMSR
jgi:hypothetical protein